MVLSACSDYFRAMFTDPMRERSQDEIQLSGIDAEGLELVLEYIYTSKLSLDLSNIQTVLSTATHLQILQVTFLQIDFTRIRISFSICDQRMHLLINNRRMFNLEIDDLAEKSYIPHKSLLQ